MKQKKALLILTIITLLFSCIQQRKNNNEESFEVKKMSKTPIPETNTFLDIDIDVNLIKKQMNSFTSSYSSKGGNYYNEEEIKKNDFIGLYYLVINSEQNIADVIVGKMIVFNSEKPWVFENTTDKFLEINLWKKGISLFGNKIEVGISKDSLISHLGNEYEIIEDVIIFKGKKLLGFFRLDEDKVDYIKVGKYADKIDYKSVIDKMTEF